jgi:hypothetical protein
MPDWVADKKRSLWSDGQKALANGIQLLSSRRAAVDDGIERRRQCNATPAARTQDRKAQESIDRGRFIQPAKRHIRRHIGGTSSASDANGSWRKYLGRRHEQGSSLQGLTSRALAIREHASMQPPGSAAKRMLDRFLY